MVERGPEAIRARFDELRGQGVRQAIADAVSDRHLVALGAAAADLADHRRLGHRHGLPENFRRGGLLAAANVPTTCRHARLEAILAGSCSTATLGQIERHRADGRPTFVLDPIGLADGGDDVARALAFAKKHLGDGPVLISSSRRPKRSPRCTSGWAASAPAPRSRTPWRRSPRAGGPGRAPAGGRRRRDRGRGGRRARRSGLRIGPPIDPGVPWTTSLGDPPLALALKSGNFGAPDFFIKAFECAP